MLVSTVLLTSSCVSLGTVTDHSFRDSGRVELDYTTVYVTESHKLELEHEQWVQVTEDEFDECHIGTEYPDCGE